MVGIAHMAAIVMIAASCAMPRATTLGIAELVKERVARGGGTEQTYQRGRESTGTPRRKRHPSTAGGRFSLKDMNMGGVVVTNQL